MSLLQAAISCQPVSSLKQKERDYDQIQVDLLNRQNLLPKTQLFINATSSLLCLLLFTSKQEAIKKMQLPKPHS